MNKLKHLLKRLYEVPPKDWVWRARRKVFGYGKDSANCVEAFSDPKNTRGQRLYDFLHRYETIIRRNNPWDNLDFERKAVLELGCGQTAGFAPLAIFLGAEKYYAVDPELNRQVLEDARYYKYLVGIHKDLSALYGERMDLGTFYRLVKARVVIVKANFLEAEIETSIDIILSNSCLEHVDPLDKTLHRLRQLCAPGARFLHAVDFGNHRPTENPFCGIYSLSHGDYVKTYGSMINLYRSPDILRMLSEAGFNARMTPYYSYKEFYNEEILPEWRKSYSEQELFTKVGLYFGEARA